MKGQIIKIISNLYYVQIDDDVIPCRCRGVFRDKKIIPLVGDYCKVDVENKYILEIYERSNSLERPAVSNIDQGLIVTSLEIPSFSPNLLDKLILIMEINKVKPIICVTKEDLISDDNKKKYRKIFEYYENIGYSIYYNYEKEKLKKIFKDKTTVFTGQTGSGKSSLFNSLSEELNYATGEVSFALGRGKHTTRVVSLVNILGGKLVDTPGFSSVDLKKYSIDDIKNSFVEFRDAKCVWKDCMHYKESTSSCLVKQKVKNGEILKTRYDDYVKFIEEVSGGRR